jgi:hypothetical protein
MNISGFFSSIANWFNSTILHRSTAKTSDDVHPLVKANTLQSAQYNDARFAKYAQGITEIGQNALKGFDVSIEVLAHGCYGPNKGERELNGQWLHAAYKAHPRLVGELACQVMGERDPLLNGGKGIVGTPVFFPPIELANIVVAHEKATGKVTGLTERANQIINQVGWTKLVGMKQGGGPTGGNPTHSGGVEDVVRDKVPDDWKRI